MNENENEFDWSDSWALLALFAMAAGMNNPDAPEGPPMLPLRTPETMHFNNTGWNTVDIDKFTIEQLRAAAMSKKEAEKLRQEMLDDARRAEEPDDYRGLYGRSWDI